MKFLEKLRIERQNLVPTNIRENVPSMQRDRSGKFMNIESTPLEINGVCNSEDASNVHEKKSVVSKEGSSSEIRYVPVTRRGHGRPRLIMTGSVGRPPKEYQQARKSGFWINII